MNSESAGTRFGVVTIRDGGWHWTPLISRHPQPPARSKTRWCESIRDQRALPITAKQTHASRSQLPTTKRCLALTQQSCTLTVPDWDAPVTRLTNAFSKKVENLGWQKLAKLSERDPSAKSRGTCLRPKYAKVSVSPVCEYVFVTVLELRLARAQDLRGLHLEFQAMVRGFDPDAVQLHDVPGLWAELAALDRLVSSTKTL